MDREVSRAGALRAGIEGRCCQDIGCEPFLWLVKRQGREGRNREQIQVAVQQPIVSLAMREPRAIASKFFATRGWIKFPLVICLKNRRPK
jgi:hypothetical protein